MTESRLPEPPFSVELLADLDAGVLDAATAAHVRERIAADPDARRILAALARTRADLKATPVPTEPPPSWVDDRTRDTLATIRSEVLHRSAAHSPPADDPAADPHADLSTRTPVPGNEPVTPLRASPRRASRRPSAWTWAALGAAAAVIVAVVAGIVVGTRPASQPVAAESGTRSSALAPSTPVTTAPNTSTPNNTEPIDTVAVLSVLGRTDGAPFSSPAALRRCTAANGIPAATPVVGSGPVRIGGVARVVILLGTGVAGRFDALVVGVECDTGRPALHSRTRIGR